VVAGEGISKEDVVKALGKTAKRFVCKDWKLSKDKG